LHCKAIAIDSKAFAIDSKAFAIDSKAIANRILSDYYKSIANRMLQIFPHRPHCSSLFIIPTLTQPVTYHHHSPSPLTHHSPLTITTHSPLTVTTTHRILIIGEKGKKALEREKMPQLWEDVHMIPVPPQEGEV
jgi:hypothetical protein